MSQIMTAKPNKIIGFFSLIILLLCAVFIFFVFSANRGATKPTAPQTTPLTAVKKTIPKAQMSLNPVSRQSVFGINEPITLLVYANSDNHDVVGFDAVVIYDPKASDYETASSPLVDFKLVANNRSEEGKLFLTGVKDLAVKTSSVFNNASIAEVTFIPKKIGKISYDLQFIVGKTNDSNLIDTKTKDVLQAANGVSIQVK